MAGKLEILPADPSAVNTGLILEAPFLQQVFTPMMMNTITDSTLNPARISTGVTTYTCVPPGVLLKEEFVGGPATKTKSHQYTPVSAGEILSELEAKAVELESRSEVAKSPGEAKVLEGQAKAVRATLRKKKKELAKPGAVPRPRLTRTTFVESSPGQVGVSGDITYVYEGSDIVESKSITRTDEDPPRVDELVKTYEYNALGQLVAIDVSGARSEILYDPTGRPIQLLSDFSSGDFLCKSTTLYAYAPPPPGEPIPGNALVTSISDSISGPVPSFDKPPKPVEPPSEPPGLPDALAGAIRPPDGAEPPEIPLPLVPSVPAIEASLPQGQDVTRVTGLFVYGP